MPAPGIRRSSPDLHRGRVSLTGAALATIYVVWGVNFVAVDVAVRDLSPAAMMGLRFTLSGALLLPIGRRLASPERDRSGAWRSAAVTAVPLFAGGSGLLAWGQTHLPSGVSAVIIATIPIWLVGLDLATRQLPATPRVVLAPLAGLGGVAIIANPRVEEPISLTGTALVLAAALSWAIGSRRSRSTKPTNVIEQTAMQMFIGGAVLLALAAALALVGQPVGTITTEGAGAMAWLIIMSSMLGFTAYTYALQHAPITAVAAYPYANTVLAVGAGALLLNESLTLNRIIGATVVIVSVAATFDRTSTNRLRQPVRHEPEL